MSVSSTDKGLLTPDNCAVIFIDHQPELLSGVANGDRQDLLDSLQVLAKAARIFGVPVILTAVESKAFSGKIAPQLLELFPDQTPIERSSMNAWDNPAFVKAVRNTGRRNFLLAALWSEACLAFPALQMLEEGYGVYAIKDASRGTSPAAHDSALRRVEQAGGVSLTALQVLLEFQRDWARGEHSEEVLAILKERCRGSGGSFERLATRVHHASGGGKPKASQAATKATETGTPQ
jgi:nicotinamidase-related amidase